MANKVYNMDGGLHSSAAIGGLEDAMYGSSVANSNSFKVTAGTGMNVNISAGNGLISTGTGFARRIASDAVNTVAITAASSANPRMDAVVAYIDNSITPVQSVLNNTNGILKFTSVAGTPAATPSAPSSATIQTAVGAGNPYMVLYNVTVPKNATSLTAATFTDVRSVANIITSGDIASSAITSAKIASNAVTTAKIANNNVTTAKLASGIVTLTRTSLYSVSGGTNTTFATSAAISGFDYVEVYYHDTNNPANNAIRLIPGNATGVVLDIPHPGGSSTVYWNIARWTVSGTAWTVSSNNTQKAIASSSVTTNNSNYIYIDKVIGVKFVTS